MMRLMVVKKVILLLLLSACAAFANSIIVQSIDASLGMSSVYINQSGTPTSIYWAGAIDINVDNFIRQVFCVQLLVDINLGQTYTTTMLFSDTANLKRVGWLLQNAFPTTALDGAAFQFAIWDIMEDNGDGMSSGNVAKSSSAANPTPQPLLDDIAHYEAISLGQSSNLGVVYHNYSGTTPVQNLMGNPVTDNGPSPVPEPGTVVLIAGGLTLIGLSRLGRGSRGR